MNLVLLFFSLSISYNAFAQNNTIPYAKYYEVPVDTLIYYEDLSLDKKIIIGTIQKWQFHSYSNEHLNCQFYPSCSNYFALSVFQNNTYWGIVKGIDRIVRCNNSAKYYFNSKTSNPTYFEDGRMIDKLILDNNKPSKSSIVATSLSVIPGLGRVYCGRYTDGLISFFSFGLLSYITYKQHEKENDILLFLSGSFTFTFWLSDFYGAYRTAKNSIVTFTL